jgi:cobalt-zinc-cadmium efflux system outer membrane protein
VAEIAAEKFKAGSAPRVDVLRTAADAARARADAAFAAASVPAAAARLAVTLGGSYDVALVADGGPGLAFADADFAVLEQRLEDHPTLRRDRAQIAAAMAHVRAEQRLRWPTVTADLTVNWNDPTLPGNDVIGGLSFEPPVLSLRGGAIARARAEQALAETTTALDGRRLHAALVDAFGRATGAGARARALASEVLPGLEEVRRMTEEGYRDGRVDLLRLLDAQRARLDSRLAEVQAEATWQRALAEIERAAGVVLDRGPSGAR